MYRACILSPNDLFCALDDLRFGVPSLPAGEQPDCGDLRGNEGFLIAESLSCTQKDRYTVMVWFKLRQKWCIIIISHTFSFWVVNSNLGYLYIELYLITQPVNNVQVVLSAVSVGEVVGRTGQLTRYFSLVDVSYASRNHGTRHRNCQVNTKSNTNPNWDMELLIFLSEGKFSISLFNADLSGMQYLHQV